MTTDRDDNPHASSSTAHVLAELQLYGWRPFQDEPDPRPLPEARVIGGAVADMFDALIATLCDTRLEPDLDDLLWSTVNLFHRAADRVRHELDDNESAQKGSQKGAERIAAAWANAREVTQIAFKPDWTRHAKAAPFRRNDQMLAVMPIGVIVFPGSGISANLADKAKKFGIPVWKFDGGA